jgi:hypothetical protein
MKVIFLFCSALAIRSSRNLLTYIFSGEIIGVEVEELLFDVLLDFCL